MKENINEHDKTKQMMDIIRNGFKTKLMTEAEEMQQQPEPTAPNNVPLERGDDLPEPEQETQQNDGFEDITPNDAVYKKEEVTMEDLFKTKPNITNFKINRKTGRVIINGYFLGGDVIPNATPNQNQVSGLYFTLDSNEYIEPTTDGSLKIDDRVQNIIGSFKPYWENFTEEWVKKMRTDFPPLNK
jgi:hypothetical protein